MYREPEDLEPGPGSYDIPQSFGQQQLSTYMSQPCSSITAKHDKSWSKVMISKEHLGALMARGTPGPGTYMPALAQSQSRVSFGTAKRRQLSDASFKAPGPVYNLPSNNEAPKTIKFGKANRFDTDNQSLSKMLGSTGPGQYEVSGSFDGSRLAKSFGASHRAYDRVRFPGSDRVGIGRNSPGPWLSPAVPKQRQSQCVWASGAAAGGPQRQAGAGPRRLRPPREAHTAQPESGLLLLRQATSAPAGRLEADAAPPQLVLGRQVRDPLAVRRVAGMAGAFFVGERSQR
eukprot:SRR837773.1515.p1 GENE.SRR837773.1515~~SRR837773.1515.p1  ORF type:complete len:338 (-),score=44.98 SRR837773.1515:43-906(-)